MSSRSWRSTQLFITNTSLRVIIFCLKILARSKLFNEYLPICSALTHDTNATNITKVFKWQNIVVFYFVYLIYFIYIIDLIWSFISFNDFSINRLFNWYWVNSNMFMLCMYVLSTAFPAVEKKRNSATSLFKQMNKT